MEIHRIKEFKGEFDSQLYLELLKKVQPLIKKLTHNVDTRRLRVSKDLVESYFEDKFLFAFQKYYPIYGREVLLGHLLTSLKMFHTRLIKKAYQQEGEFNNSSLIDLEDLKTVHILPEEDGYDEKDILRGIVIDFFKKNLPEDAFMIFEIQLYPPIYILKRLEDSNKKIPTSLLIEYLGLPKLPKISTYINKLRALIDETTDKARVDLAEISPMI